MHQILTFGAPLADVGIPVEVVEGAAPEGLLDVDPCLTSLNNLARVFDTFGSLKKAVLRLRKSKHVAKSALPSR